MKFLAKCQNFKQLKAEHQNSGGLHQEIEVPTWKWKDINMDFLVGLPRTQKQYDSIWVVVDRLTKFSPIISVKSIYLAVDYAKIFIDEIVLVHGIPISIIPDKGAQFTSRYLRSFQKGSGTKVKLITSFILKQIVKLSVLFKP